MRGETLTLLIKFLPTILTLIIILLCMLRGLMRGFRKSLILFIQYLIGLAVGIACYFAVSKWLITANIGWAFDMIGGKFAEANTVYDFIVVAIKDFVPNLAPATSHPYIQDVLLSIAGVAISLVSGIVCLVVIPLLVRGIFYILYLIFYREGKRKRHILAEGEDYRPHRLLGMVVGAARGLVCSFLLVSIITTSFFVVSGGSTEAKDSDILESLGETVGVDINAIYKGVVESRNTGVGLLYNTVKLGGMPMDVAYANLFVKSSYTYEKYVPISEKVTSLVAGPAAKGEMTQLSLMEELTLLCDLAGIIAKTEAISIENGDCIVNVDTLDVELTPEFKEYFYGSEVFSDILPFSVIGMSETIQKGEIKLAGVEEVFTEDFVDQIKHIDFAGDMAQILSTGLYALQLLPIEENSKALDTDSLNSVNTYTKFDVPVVKEYFNRLSEISLLTNFIFPVSLGTSLQVMNDDITAAGMEAEYADFNDIDWSFEIRNLGNVYEQLVALDVDLEKLLDSSVDPETNTSKNITYITELLNDETTSLEFKQQLSKFIDIVFESNLLSQCALIYTKSSIAKAQFVQEDGTVSPLNDAFDLVRENMNHYTKEHLRLDLHTAVNSCLDSTSLIPVFQNNTGEYFKMLNDIKTDDVRNSILGRYNPDTGLREGGIYALSLFNGNLDGVGGVDEGCHFATDALIEAALKTYGAEFMSADVVNSVTKVKDPTDPEYDFDAWPKELGALIDGIEDLQTVECLPDIKLELAEGESVTDILPPTMTNEDIDVITEAASKSILLSGIIEEKFVTTLSENEDFGYAAKDENIVWMDRFEDLTPDIENEADKTYHVHYGELNHLLKSFRVFSDDEKNIDINNNDSLINGLAQMLKEDTSENPDEENPNVMNGLDYEEVIYVAKSQVLMTVLSGEISELNKDSEAGEEETKKEDLAIVVPDTLNTKINADNWRLWSYNGENNLDHKKGEFAKLCLVLYHARQYALEKEVALTSDEEEVPNPYTLNMDNLLNSVVYMEHDTYVTDSLVLYATSSDALMKENGKIDSILYVPDRALVENPYENDDVKIKKEEVTKLFDVVRNLEVNLEGNSFGDINLQTALDRIGEADVRESICVSTIFNASTVNKITESEDVIVPRQFQRVNVNNVLVADLNNSVWYPVEDENWEDCELNKMLISINELEIESTGTENEDSGNNNKLVVPEIDDIIQKLDEPSSSTDELGNNVGGTKLDQVYNSIIFRTTISNHLLKRDDVKFRQAAYEEETFVVTEGSYNNIRKAEIAELVFFLKETGITFKEGFNKDQIINSLPNPTIRESVVTSNILNITVVNLLGESKDIAIPVEYMHGENVNLEGDWYIVEDNPETSTDESVSWDNTELGRILASVVELNIKVEKNENEEETLVVPEITSLLKSLNANSQTQVSENPEEIITSLDVVYLSDVIKETIKKNILEQEKRDNQDNTNKNLWIRDEAFEHEDRSEYFKKDEIKLLSDFVNARKEDGTVAEIDINNISNKLVFELLGVKGNRETITKSNILSITVVDRFESVSDLSFQEQYLKTVHNSETGEDEQKVDRNAEAWYPVDSDWQSCELAKLLASVHELNLASYVDPVTDEIVIPSSTDLIKGLNQDSLTSEATVSQTRLEIVYLSDTLSLTISDKITSSDQIAVREVAYQTDEYDNYTDILREDEVAYLIEFINLTNINLENTESNNDGEPLNAETIFNLLHDTEMHESGVTRGQKIREMIVISNILNRTTVDKVAEGTNPNSEASLKFAKAYLHEDGTICDETQLWYPASADSYEDCELYHLLASLDDLDIKATGNNITLSINENIDTILDDLKDLPEGEESILDRVYLSDNIAMTISTRLNKTTSGVDSYRLPTSQANGNSVYDLIANRRVLEDKIINEEELERLLIAINCLGLKFHDENDPDYEFKFEDVFKSVTLTDLQSELDKVLASSIIHHVLSDNLIKQKQQHYDESRYIVTNTSFMDKVTENTIVNFVGATEDRYIEKAEISLAVDILISFGFNKVDDAANVGLQQLKYFGSENTNRAQLIASVSESAIMSKIFSQILITNNILAAVEANTGKTYDRVMVDETYTSISVNTLTRDALSKFLTDNTDTFDKLNVGV